MKRHSVLAALAMFGVLAAAGSFAFAQPAGPMVRADATQKISAHVWTIPDNSVPGVPNVGIIVGETAALIIDTGMGPANGQTILAEAQKLAGQKKLYLVTTHVHPEHDLGAQAFPASTTLIRSTDQVREIGEEGMRTGDIFRARSETNRKLLEGVAFRAADLTFTGSHTLDLGGVTVQLLALGPGHTQGDTAVWVEADRVLFSGDLAMKALPAFASAKSSVKQWLITLDRFDALKPAIVVPSHGPNGDAGYIGPYRDYLKRVQARAAALKAEGKTVEQAIETISAELKADYPDTSRAAGAIRAAYAEAG